MVSGLSRLRLLSVLLPLVLVALPLGGSLSARPATPSASSQSSATPDRLSGVACARPSTCLAVGEARTSTGTIVGTIVRSTDGGRTWRSQDSATPNTGLSGVACARPSTCVAVGQDGILRTTDGGNTWRSPNTPPSGTTGYLTDINGVACPSPSTCVAVGSAEPVVPHYRLRASILRSTDGGRTWSRIQ
jgi:hypothetical protein